MLVHQRLSGPRSTALLGWSYLVDFGMTHWRVSDTSANELFKRRVAAASQRILAQDMMDAETERLERREQVDHFILGVIFGISIGALVMFGIMV